jgi:ABC-type Fe3+-hydroxamate transport system substrate-binding protein
MKTAIFVFLLAVAVCAGCATRYNLTLSNGEIITAKGKPHLNAAKNTYIYKDATGQTNFIPAANVTQIAPASMGDDSPTKFNPAVKK